MSQVSLSGKVLGGSSAINFEIFNRPAALEYSAWSALNLGQGDWSWNGLLPYFKKSETYTPPLAEDAFPNPSPTRRGLFLSARDDETTTSTDNSTLIPSTFFDSADSALNFTALDVEALIAAAGVADTLAGTFETTDTNSNTTDVDTTETSPAGARRSMLEKRTDPYHGSSGPVQGSFNTWYSDIASPFIKTAQNLGININNQPVRRNCVVRFSNTDFLSVAGLRK